MRHYCTLFDKNYLAKGMSLYQSLQMHSKEPFTLWVLPLDSETQYFIEDHENVLTKLRMVPWTHLDSEIRELQSNRSWSQFCWTLASHLTRMVMEITDAPVTYLDSDLYFYADPEIAHEEIANKQVGIVPHRFPPHDADRLRPAGLYNVSWVTFKTSETARVLLDWWCAQVKAKCDASTCGDQKYLDAWPGALGSDLHIFENIGIGPGPWNAYTYDIQPGPKLNGQQLVFYHFHELQRINGNDYKLTGYPVTDNQKKYVYEPYLRSLRYMQYHIDKELPHYD